MLILVIFIQQIQQTNIRNALKLIKTPLLNSILQRSFYNQFFMEYQARICKKPTNYAKIPLNKRTKLVELVQQKKLSITKASAKLGIRPSTAKLILKKFREEGSFFEKKSDRLARLASFKQPQERSPSQNIPQQTQPPLYNCNEGMQLYEMSSLPKGAYMGMQTLCIGEGEWNRMQNYSFGGSLDYGQMQWHSSGFFL